MPTALSNLDLSSGWLVRWLSLLGLTILFGLSGGCAHVNPDEGGAASVSQVINLDHAVIQGTDIKIINIIGGVAGIPSGFYSQYRSTLDSPGLQQAKLDLRIIQYNPSDPRPELEPTAVGWRATVDYSVRIENVSSVNSYTISGDGLCAGIYENYLVKSDSGRLRSNALHLAPGERGTLRFHGTFVVQDIIRKARKQNVPLDENMIYFFPPNDGADWRPNWPGYLGLVIPH